MAKHAFVTLDGLRGIAAATIVPLHAPDFFRSGRPFESYLAVDFFFMLSGFVLAHAYEKKLCEGMSAGQFMTVRLIRLYPLYLLALGIAIAPILYETFRGREDVMTVSINVLCGVFFLPSPVSTTELFPLNAPAWSLFFELLANGVFALLITRLGTRALAYFVAFNAATLALAVAFGLLGFDQPGNGAMAAGHLWDSFGAGVLRVAFAFFAGNLLYRIWLIQKSKVHLSPLLAALILTAILLSHPPVWMEQPFDLVVTMAIFPLLILGAAPTKPGKFLGPFFAALGLASYGVYVLQDSTFTLSMYVFYKALGPRVMSHLPEIAGIAFILFMFVMALLLDYSFDLPIRRYLSGRLIQSRRAAIV